MNIDRIARWGFLARAAVYFLMGGFALLLAFGNSMGDTTDPRGALRKLLEQPFGQVLLAVLAIGLFCYSVWRFIQAYRDPDRAGTGAKGIALRIGYVIGGTTHALLGIYAVKLILNLSSKSGMGEKGIAHWLLTKPFGQFLTFAVGAIIIGFGLAQIYTGFKGKFAKKLSLPSDKRESLVSVCKVGLIARGLVFSLIGFFFCQAALHFNSQEAGGISEAWRTLREQPFGKYMIMAVAIGFLAFSVYGLLESMYYKHKSALA